jgi:hypothetical protein
MKTKALAFAVSAALLAGAPSVHARGVEDADAAKVANCTFVKDVDTPTQGKGKYTRAAIGTAMEEARKDAAKAGATHIVWDKISSADVTKVTGKAYQCAK